MKNFTTDDYLYLLKCRKDLKDVIRDFREAPQSDDYSYFTNRIRDLTNLVDSLERDLYKPCGVSLAESGADVPVDVETSCRDLFSLSKEFLTFRIAKERDSEYSVDITWCENK